MHIFWKVLGHIYHQSVSVNQLASRSMTAKKPFKVKVIVVSRPHVLKRKALGNAIRCVTHPNLFQIVPHEAR